MINENRTSEKIDTAGTELPVALLVCTDLMFGVPLRNMALKTGYRPVTLKPGSPILGGAIMVVDMGARGDWEAAVREAVGRGIPVVAFGSHMDAEARKRAKSAGALRVLANSNLARELPAILLSLQAGSDAERVHAVDNDEQEPDR